MRIKKTKVISFRVTLYFWKQMRAWAIRAGLSWSDFLTMALIYGARYHAKNLGVFEKSDEIDELEIHNWHKVEW